MTKSMKCFDVVKTVLDATYAEVPNADSDKDSRIKKALDSMSDQYNNKLMSEGGPDFSDAMTRFGYVLRYVPAHSHWLYELIAQCPTAIDVLKSGKARVTCLGGGPGSDVVGILKYLDESGISCKLFCEIIDGCEAWKITWSDLAFQLDLDNGLHTDYVIHKVDDEGTWTSSSRIQKADIVTINFFASEIHHLETSETYLNMMLSQTKVGAIIFVNDNRTPEVYERLDKIAAGTGHKILVSGEGLRKIYDPSESMSVLADYIKKFGASRLTGKMAWRIYQKM